MALKANDMSVTYPGGKTALRPVSLDFHRGQFSVLLGPSGAGKSTLLRCLNYLCRPSTGYIVVGGIGVLDSRARLREHRRRTAMIFQQHQLVGRQSALQNVMTGRLGYHSWLRSLIPLAEKEMSIGLECLDRVGVLHKALSRVSTLSGGEQQRVGIARALAQQPTVILADEPVASLDPETSRKVISLLHRICREDGITAVVSLHQVDLAREYADRVIGISEGRVVFDGAPGMLSEGQLYAIYDHGACTQYGVTGQENGAGEKILPALATLGS
ncbi:MAG: phosphonate ABC transporter ATP-binding protein [Nitrospiraceae bacterium]|nr:phosphonate ABC transporter ATP-binding protein [Nitrospiraceae bacterium]